MRPGTRLVHFESCPNDSFRPVATPLYLTTTFEQESALEFGQYEYSRSGNPTRAVLERRVADLEGAARAFCFSSGMAAIMAITRLLKPGDEILASAFLYGGTCRLFARLSKSSGIGVRYVGSTKLEDFRREIGPTTRLIYIETPTNPMLHIIDIVGVAKIAHESSALLCVDNTMMSPYLQNPLLHGADLVVHSATKSLAGHSDVTAGVVAVSNRDIGEEVYSIQSGEGAVLSPFDCYLFLRGMKTLGIRLDRQESNTQKIVKFLAQQPAVRYIHYPGFNDKGAGELHSSQARGRGCVISLGTGSKEVSRRFVETLKLFTIALSFGSVTSSVSMPAFMSHVNMPPSLLSENALPGDLVRLSIGIEDADDLIEDLSQALAKA
jgi:cysteine-S-conjugate beta-lyase